ncbi:MAG: protease Lon-related BREX system protein BrxL [Ignavibacteria bacterium]|nr:protease Lon-related BREX system protein BrxL [Ignavibacteria bacterium]
MGRQYMKINNDAAEEKGEIESQEYLDDIFIDDIFLNDTTDVPEGADDLEVADLPEEPELSDALKVLEVPLGTSGTVSENLNSKLNDVFAGKIVRKDLTKKIKEGANVPVYVLEYLLGMYCATTDEASIEQGVQSVKSILAENFVHPDEAQKIISKIRENSLYTVIDKVSVKLNYRNDYYEAEFSNLGIKNIPISEKYPSDYERLLCGGIWCIVQLGYFYDEADRNRCPFIINKLTPIQMPNLDLAEVLAGREHFTKDEWIDILMRSIGMEPSKFSYRVKLLLLARMIPLVENNFNLCELGPRGTGKSHVYKEISPNSILVSGGHTTVANLFYNMANKTVGLVGMWDCVAFDEVAGISFKDKDGVQIMKDYMASGSFARGKEEKNASASMGFVGNINQSVAVLLKTSHLFEPFPEEMANDSAFFDRIHCYIPGWEIPKYRPESFTNDYGFITDYLSEFLRELRKISYADTFDKYFRLGNNLNQRDVIGVRKMVSGLVKLIYPDGKCDKSEIEEILRFALESRRRVKEQLKKIGGMEFYDVNFSYIDNESFAEEFVPVPEQGGGKLIPEGLHKPGQLYTVGRGKSGMIGVFKFETEMVTGSGKFERTGLGSDKEAKESVETAFRYLKANSRYISGSISTTTKDYLMHVQDLNGIGITNQLALAALVALCSAAISKPVIGSLAVLGNLSIGGTIIKVDELANVLQVCLDSGAKKVLLPITSAIDMGTVPPELMGKFSLIFYQSAEDAVFKALGVE